MRAHGRAAAIAAAAACAAAACAGPGAERPGAPGDSDLRIWAPPLVRWEPGVPRSVEFSIENPTWRTIAIAAPDPALARVDVLAGPESIRLCGVAPAERVEPGERVSLAPGGRVAVRVELDEACGAVPPGEYRYEVGYRAAQPAGGDAFSGALPVRYGQVFVSAALAEEGSLGATPADPAPARQGRAGRPRAARGPAAEAGPAAPADGR